MPVTFDRIAKGETYSRPRLAGMWGYSGYEALARGVVTPRDTHFIILFVTEDKQPFQEQYSDRLNGDVLHWEGPTDHFAEERMVNASDNRDEIHVFHRLRHHSDFTYLGKAKIIEVQRLGHRPSRFTFRLE